MCGLDLEKRINISALKTTFYFVIFIFFSYHEILALKL